jgi:hypothetical protein
MTYYYKIKGTLARKEGGDPPNIDEYTVVGKDNIVRHVKDGQIIDERAIEFPEDATSGDLRDLYKSTVGYMITKNMLYPKYRRKSKSKPKSIRKTKIVTKHKHK